MGNVHPDTGMVPRSPSLQVESFLTGPLGKLSLNLVKVILICIECKVRYFAFFSAVSFGVSFHMWGVLSYLS